MGLVIDDGLSDATRLTGFWWPVPFTDFAHVEIGYHYSSGVSGRVGHGHDG